MRKLLLFLVFTAVISCNLRAQNPPQNVTSTVNCNIITLSWQSPLPDPGGTVSGYKIYRNNLLIDSTETNDTVFSFEWANIGNVNICITAIWNPFGESVPSCTSDVINPAMPPTGFNGIPPVNDIFLWWNAPEITTPIGYNLYRNGILRNSELITDTFYYDPYIMPCQWEYTLTAVYPDCDSIFGGTWQLAWGCTFNPENIQAVADGYDVHLTWTSPVNNTRCDAGVDFYYNVYRNNEKINQYPVNVLQFDDLGLSPGTYIYEVTAVYPECEEGGAYSYPITILTCPPPTGFTGTDSIPGCATFSWIAPYDTTLLGYNIYENGILQNDSLITNTYFSDTIYSPCSSVYVLTAVYPVCDSVYGGSVTFFPTGNYAPLSVYAYQQCENVAIGWGSPSGNDDNRNYQYNVYRNGQLLTNVPIADLTFIDAEPDTGRYYYRVSTIYAGCEFFMEDSVYLHMYYRGAPKNFDGYGFQYGFNVWWSPVPVPFANSFQTELRYDNGINYDGIGLDEGETFTAAIRFEPEQLIPYGGFLLNRVKIFPRGNNTNYTLKIWTGENAGSLIREQPLSGLAIEQWNTINLNVPVVIDSSHELWIGYSIVQPMGEFPAGVDEGPAVAGYGDMISLNDSEWEALSGYGYNYNWNICGLVDYDGKEITLKPVSSLQKEHYTNTCPYTIGKLPKALKFKDNKDNSVRGGLLGYNVYLYPDPFGFQPFFTQDTFLKVIVTKPSDFLCDFWVTALYSDCESEPSNIITLLFWLDVNEVNGKSLTLTPNPAKDYVTIVSDKQMQTLTLFSMQGQAVFTRQLTEKKTTVSLSGIPHGLYMLKLVSGQEVICKKLVIE
jgi:hypothetical protein